MRDELAKELEIYAEEKWRTWRDVNRIPATRWPPRRDDYEHRSAAKLLTKDEARRIASNIAKLPELLRRHQTWGVR